MYKLEPFVSEKIWGYERWIVSTHQAGQSTARKPDDESTGVPLSEIAGDYPLLIKVIQADETLSVQVHPDDEYAKIHENSRGKTECWYVLDTKPDTTLICGLTGEYTPEELRAAIEENRLEPYMRSIPVGKGDFVFIPAGTVHAINGGLRLLEVQESSDITYRLYDWGRGRKVHVEQGLAVTKHLQSNPVVNFKGPFSCEYFTLERIESAGNATEEITDKNDFVVFVLEGSGIIRSVDRTEAHCEPESVLYCRAGERIALPATLSVMKITAS